MLTTLEELFAAFSAIMKEIILLFPKVALAALVAFIAIAAMKLVNKFIKWLVRVSKLEEFILGAMPSKPMIPISSILSIFADIGVAIAAIAVMVRIFVPEYTELYRESLNYIARVASAVFLSLIFLIGLTALVKTIKLEKKMESFFTMLAFLLILVMLIDLTALGPEIKSAIGLGIAIGIGLTIGAFALWMFFSEYVKSPAKGG